MPAPAPRRARPERHARPPSPLERSLVRERARRRAKLEHERERARAKRRFLALVAGLLFIAVVLAFTIWDQIQALFGL
jgi:hypothetical protein